MRDICPQAVVIFLAGKVRQICVTVDLRVFHLSSCILPGLPERRHEVYHTSTVLIRISASVQVELPLAMSCLRTYPGPLLSNVQQITQA